MRNDREYQICKDIAIYMRYQYPTVIYRFDMAGLNLSKAQAGMNKAIQYGKGYPDLFIAQASKDGRFHALFIELKPEGTKILNKSLQPATPHLAEQYEMIIALRERGYKAEICVGWDQAQSVIDQYLK